MADVNDVAKYFLFLDSMEEDSDGITNMKLQKLAYYAQGFFLAVYSKPLFLDQIQAWAHGPVVGNLYHAYKCYDRQRLPYVGDYLKGSLDKKEVAHLNEIYRVFGQYSASQLRRMTHAEPPWVRHEMSADVISEDELRDYFKSRLS